MASSEIAQYLSDTLSTDTNVRIAAELKISALTAAPETALALAQLILTQDAQHSASVVLRKYVTEHWSPFFTQFKGCAPPVEVKTQIRQALFQGLSDQDRRVRSLCARTLSSIASCDWPDEYPDLLESLISLLSSYSPNSVDGAMQVFAEFVRSDLTEDQLLPVLRRLLPTLLTILGAHDRYSPLTRARTISVFRQCIEMLYMVKDQYPQAAKEATTSILGVWLDAFKVLLNIDPRQDVENTPNWDGLAIRVQIFKTLDTIHQCFPRAVIPYLEDFLNAALNHLTVLYPAFSHYYLQCLDSVPSSSEEENINLTQLASPILDFSASVIKRGKAKDWFTQANTTAFVSAVFNWAQMTVTDEEEWANDANIFISNDSDESYSYSTRMAGFDLLSALGQRSSKVATSAFQAGIEHAVSECSKAREAGQADWWRILEATLAAVGSQADMVMDRILDDENAKQAPSIDIKYVLSTVIPPILGLPDCPFLQGRAFVFASQYSDQLSPELATKFLDAAIQVLETPDASIPVKVSAVKAIQNFCGPLGPTVLKPLAPRIASDIGPFLAVTTEDTLSLVLDTLSAVVEVSNGDWINVDLASAIVNAVIDVWSKNQKDPLFVSVITDIIQAIASSPSPGVYHTAVSQTLPRLCQAMASVNYDWYISEHAIDIASGLVQGAPETGLGDGFIAQFAPSLFDSMAITEDRDVIQSGISCLTQIIRKDCNQLVAWTNPKTGASGLNSVLAVIAKQLQEEYESGGLVIGDLIIHLLRRAGDGVLPVLPDLLRSMVTRMVSAKTATFLQSLIIPFAFLIHNGHRDTILDLLESTNVEGRSGLDILIQTWCENAETFQGFWATRISELGLCALFASERLSLRSLMVKGDIIVKPETKNVIMTRSKTKQMPTEFTSVPFPVKALKILLHELQGGDSASMGLGNADLGDLDSDDGDEDWTEEEKLNQGFNAEEFQYLSDVLGPRGLDTDEPFLDSDDDDLKNDPICQLDMPAHITSFLRECASRNTQAFSTVVDQLSAEEIILVQKSLSN